MLQMKHLLHSFVGFLQLRQALCLECPVKAHWLGPHCPWLLLLSLPFSLLQLSLLLHHHQHHEALMAKPDPEAVVEKQKWVLPCALCEWHVLQNQLWTSKLVHRSGCRNQGVISSLFECASHSLKASRCCQCKPQKYLVPQFCQALGLFAIWDFLCGLCAHRRTAAHQTQQVFPCRVLSRPARRVCIHV